MKEEEKILIEKIIAKCIHNLEIRIENQEDLVLLNDLKLAYAILSVSSSSQ